MAPPRQRPVAGLDDSRSEASSTREKPGGTKGRKTAANSAANAAGHASSAHSSKDAKGSLPAIAAAGRHNVQTSSDTLPSIQWSTMPLPILHEYRHVYNLPCHSAYATQINSILLSQGIGLRSATSIANRRAKLQQEAASNPSPTSSSAVQNIKHPDLDAQSSTSSSSSLKRSRRLDNTNPFPAADSFNDTNRSGIENKAKLSKGSNLYRVSKPPVGPSQGRVTKDQLANAVRKHFNNTAISEQDAIARFLYKVSEERKGREFRLRFQP
ncbi:hypothetical protein FQN57_005962 [Myotisia sp. PD_48]|nr:hypothetical protein FQN57_005962 [Myotisia sp. PD_48]